MLSACGSKRPQPADLGAAPNLIAVQSAWSARGAAVGLPLDLQVSGGTVTLAGSDGSVVALDGRTGREIWRGSAGAPLAAAVGGDGTLAAVVTRGNELVLLNAGAERWRQKLPAQGFTAPLVAGGRVFVLAADRSVSAYDAADGRRLWQLTRPGEPLVLQQSGVLVPFGDNLLAGLSGRLVAINPDNGTVRWEAPIASPRGTNDVERLVDLVGRTSRAGSVLCARAFQSSVGCVDTQRGNVLWSKPASGAVGIHGDADALYGAESDGKLLAWRRSDGERLWSADRLLHRRLTAPLVLGRSLIVGDDSGNLHVVSRQDGSLLNRLATDSSGIAAAPVLVGNDTVVAVTRSGGVYAFRPE